MHYFLPALLLAVASFAALASNALAQQQQGSAPFCAVDNSGTWFQCYYYSLDSCRAAAGPSGSCVVSQLRNNGNLFDFGSRGRDVLSEAQRWRNASPPPAPTSGLSARQLRWLELCRDMEQSYFNDYETFYAQRLSQPLTTEEYARLTQRARERGEYCRAMAR